METNNRKTGASVTLLIIVSLVIAAIVIFIPYQVLKKANSTARDKAIADNTEVVRKTADEIERNVNDIEESLISLIKNADMEKLLNSSEASAEDIIKVFEDYKNSHNEIINVFMGTENKRMLLYPAVELPGDYDPTVRPWYRNTVANNGLVWSEPYVDMINGDSIVTISLPVYRGNKFLGVLAADCNLNVMTEAIKENQLKPGGYMYITNQQNIAIIHPDPKAVGQVGPMDQLNNLTLNQDIGHLLYQYNGLKKIVVYSKIDKLDLTLIGIAGTKP